MPMHGHTKILWLIKEIETFHSLAKDGHDEIHVCFYQMCSTLFPQLQKYVFLDMNIKCGVLTLKHLFKLDMTQ